MDEKNIGTLAKFVGISLHTIKYYERIGLLSSNRDEKSNYRRYDLSVCTDLAECIRYRNMGFSLKELDILKKTADSKILERMLEERLTTLEEEVKKAVQLRDFVKEFKEECRLVEEELGEWYIESCKQVFYLRMQTKNLTFTEENLATGSVNIMDYAPRTMGVAILERDYLRGGRQQFSWGQSVSYMERQPLFEENPDFIRLEPKKVFVVYRRYTGRYIASGEMAADIRRLFHEYAPVFPDHAYAFRIKITHDQEGNDWNYFKIVVPLK